MFSHHNGIKLEINNRKITGKSSNTWELSSILPNNPWVRKEVSVNISKMVKKEVSVNIFKMHKIEENENAKKPKYVECS